MTNKTVIANIHQLTNKAMRLHLGITTYGYSLLYLDKGADETILPVNICDKVVIGAGAVVTKDIKEPGVYIGNPAKKN